METPPPSISALPVDLATAGSGMTPTGLAAQAGLGLGAGLVSGFTKKGTGISSSTALSGTGPVEIGGSGSGQRGGYYANFGGGTLSDIVYNLGSNPLLLALAIGGAIIIIYLLRK